MNVIIDFETRSELDLTVVGSTKYINHESTDILMLGYKIDDNPVKVWVPGDIVPTFDKGATFYAFNAKFDVEVWNTIFAPKYGARKLTLDHVVDAQALCARYGLPQNLLDAARVLAVKVQKDTNGKALIKLFCSPPYGRDSKGAILLQYAKAWDEFVRYNIHDVDSTYYVIQALPASALSESENRIFRLNYEINARGIPVAVEEAKRIFEVTTTFLDEHNQRLPDLTDGKVTKITQVKRIKDWMESRGFYCESLSADILSKWLQRTDLPDDIMEVLEIRAGMGLSSLGKYKRILDMSYNNRMFDNSRYYGAHTGRITGMGFQLLNMPRAKVKDPEAEIEKFNDTSIVFENPVLSARALVRPMIKAEPGKVIIAADYSSIEFIGEVWLCEEHTAVKRFDSGFDQYKDLATGMYGVAYDDITEDQRQMGKMGILGCGYGLGPAGFIRYADKWGVKLSLEEATKVVKMYRNTYKGVPNFWYALNSCAINAVDMPGKVFETNRCQFKVVKDRNGRPWLALTLPSERVMYYYNPSIEEGKYGPNVCSWSVDQKTKTWSRKYMSPGKWAENVIQAISRDLLYYGKLELDKAGYPIIFSVYDEVVAEVDEKRADLNEFVELMTALPSWAKGLPLKAKGYINNRYKKD